MPYYTLTWALITFWASDFPDKTGHGGLGFYQFKQEFVLHQGRLCDYDRNDITWSFFLLIATVVLYIQHFTRPD